jgi:hypothetical protein
MTAPADALFIGAGRITARRHNGLYLTVRELLAVVSEDDLRHLCCACLSDEVPRLRLHGCRRT